MKKLSVVLVLILIGLLALNPTAYSRRGCCSHHGGVCGCRCCDGTSLSAKCSPYYPNCSSTKTLKKYESYDTTAYSGGEKKELVYVGSVNSDKYHYSWCKWAKKIYPKNLKAFSSANEARDWGYKPCKICKPPMKD